MNVFKYPLKEGEQTFEVPKGAEIVDLKAQYGMTVLYLLVDPSQPRVRRTFLTVQTGREFTPSGKVKPVGTTMFREGRFVLHTFEVLAQ